MAQMLVSDFGGEVPDNTADLVKLPGVGRKTANVVQAVWYGKAKIAVDTHVYRVSHRMGLVSQKANTPLKVELELMKYIPEEDVSSAHHWLLLHGRYICQSQRPKCEKCQFDQICPKRLTSSKLAWIVFETCLNHLCILPKPSLKLASYIFKTLIIWTSNAF